MSSALPRFVSISLTLLFFLLAWFFTTTANAFGAASVDVAINGFSQGKAKHTGWKGTGDWSKQLRTQPGNHALTAFARHPSGQFSPAASHNFSANIAQQTVTTNWEISAPTIQGLARVTEETTTAEPIVFTATGNVFGAASVDVAIDGFGTGKAIHSGWQGNGDWSKQLRVQPGNHVMLATAHHPSASGDDRASLWQISRPAAAQQHHQA